jgi:oligopeptidase B
MTFRLNALGSISAALLACVGTATDAQTPAPTPQASTPPPLVTPAKPQTSAMTPPVAKRIPKTFENFGDKRVDEYFWLREKENPDVTAYLKAENEYTESVLGHLKPFQEQLYKDMLSRIKETDDNVPYFMRGYWYNSRTEMGKQYPIFTRRKGSLDAKEEITLDGNELAKGQKFMSIGTMAVSGDNKMLAYSVDFNGFRQYTLQFKNLETGELSPTKIERVTSVAWANDNKTIFYVTEDEKTKRSDKVFRHVLGSNEFTQIFEEKDELYNVGVENTRSREYIIITSESSETTEHRPRTSASIYRAKTM